MRRAYVVMSSAGVLAATLSPNVSAAASTWATAAPAAVAWGPCTDPPLVKDHAQCGYLSVPLDYSRPSGTRIQIAVSRIKHTSSTSDYQGVIVTNPGGPGGSGLDTNTSLISSLQGEGYGAAAADYDWIGFDPRGVGSSRPAISCIPDYFSSDRPNYVPLNTRVLNFWLSKSQSYAQACDGANPLQSALLRNMTTRDVAMDIDGIRQALGQPQITYYGFSYGTEIGQVYSTLFPSHVKRLILDSNVDPLRNGYHNVNLSQDGPFNRNEDMWFAWIARYHTVFHLGSTESAVQHAFYAAEVQLASHPADGKVGPDEWVDIFAFPVYSQRNWVRAAQLFAAWVHEHNKAVADILVSAYEFVDTPGSDNNYAVYLSVNCTDSHWPLNWSVWDQDVSAIYRRAPYEAWSNAWFNAPCIFWTAPSSNPVQVNGLGVSSALLIDETLDAATPFEGSLAVRNLFPRSVLVAEPGGTGHAESLSGDRCVDGTIATYLETGKLPLRKQDAEWDKTCAPPPVPAPTARTASSSAGMLLGSRAPRFALVGG